MDSRLLIPWVTIELPKGPRRLWVKAYLGKPGIQDCDVSPDTRAEKGAYLHGGIFAQIHRLVIGCDGVDGGCRGCLG